jgi:GNAT superfamily N-acetyltransferase
MAVHVRPIRPDDGELLVEFHKKLSPQSVYLRFFSPHPTLSPAEIKRFTHVDYADRLALVVEVDDTLVAVGRYERTSDTEAEVAFVVADAFQHHGIASMLLELLAQAAWMCGINTLVASTLPENHQMVGVFTHSRFKTTMQFDGGLVSIRTRIDPTYHHSGESG